MMTLILLILFGRRVGGCGGGCGMGVGPKETCHDASYVTTRGSHTNVTVVRGGTVGGGGGYFRLDIIDEYW